ncbi:MAG: S41 family peptidase, partial [Planctomycetota bacterium]
AQVFKTVMKVIQQGHLEGDKVKTEDLLDAALNGMLHSMDEHSTYMDSKYFQRFEQDLEAEYGGIGAYVATDVDDGLFTITHPIYSGPAYKAGLVTEDKIVRIDDWPTLHQPNDEVIKRLKGRPGTKVKLYVWRRGMETSKIDRPTDDMIVEVQRAKIEIPTVQWQMLPGKVGLISLLEFSRIASQEVRAALISLQEQGMQSLILDLRNNPGGLLDEAVAVATPFLPKGTKVVSTESRIDPGETHLTKGNPMIPADMPMAVLVNRFSASAAEIVSGALQDERRATIVGQRSFGKGSVQKLLNVPGMSDDKYVDENKNGRHDNWEPLTKDWNNNGEFDFAPHIKLTVSRYLLPSGRSIHRELDKDGNILPGHRGGIEPDVEVEARNYESWRIEEMVRLQSSRKIRAYVDEHFEANKDLFSKLAENDQRDVTRYPDFEAFLAKLGTPIPPDDVRQLIRIELRRRVQDLRGKEFPAGDFVEDVQLQEAIRVVLDKLNKTPAEIAEYKSAIPPTTHGRLLAKIERRSLEETLDQLRDAKKTDGKLSPELIERLQEMLQASLDGGH